MRFGAADELLIEEIGALRDQVLDDIAVWRRGARGVIDPETFSEVLELGQQLLEKVNDLEIRAKAGEPVDDEVADRWTQADEYRVLVFDTLESVGVDPAKVDLSTDKRSGRVAAFALGVTALATVGLIFWATVRD